tara:strand:+ start:465 stop:1259 length:795 start_codon:yes stop_codon:yes gene_type:complete
MVAEAVKFSICFLYVLATSGKSEAWKILRATPTQSSLSLPCVLYVAQNNLLFDAVKNLPTTLYVVCSQGKILTSAFFSYALLGSKTSNIRIIALVLLMGGMVMVQAPGRGYEALYQKPEGNTMRGLCSILLACLTSGFAGVYLEKLYKSGTESKSLWAKNMQLSCFSLPLSFLLASQRNASSFGDLFSGYDTVVVGVILLQAMGGLIVALVMRYASTILKCFAVSASICLCTVISITGGQEDLTAKKIVGISIVNVATLLYGMQ